MQIVDEIPAPRNAEKYPWAEIDQAVKAGSIVALDADEYGVANANSIKTVAQRYSKRQGKGWVVTVRGRVAYIRSQHEFATGVLGR